MTHINNIDNLNKIVYFELLFAYSMHHPKYNAQNRNTSVLQGPSMSLLASILLRGHVTSYYRRLMAERVAPMIYRRCGADIGVTNTFGKNDYRLEEEGDWILTRMNDAIPTPNMKRKHADAIANTRRVFKENTLGSIGPIFDSTGKHDAIWNSLSESEQIQAGMIHAAQIRIFQESGVPYILGEAFRYVNEAKGLIQAAKDKGIRKVVICFRLNQRGQITDPKIGSLTLKDLKRDLQKEAGDDIEVLVGANCTGMSNIEAAFESGDEMDFAYPNELDFRTDSQQKTFEELIRKENKTHTDRRMHSEMRERHATSLTRFEAFFEKGSDKDIYNLQGMGACCGSDHKHVFCARKVVDREFRVIR